MIAAVAVDVLVAVLFTAAAPRWGRRLPPAHATRVLVTGSIAVAGSVVFVLAVVSFTWVGQLPQIAALGPWSPAALRALSPVPDLIAAAATLLLILLAVRLAQTVVGRLRAVGAVRRTCRRLPGTSSLVVVDSDVADAFTTPQRRGRIVVTTGLLRGLAPAERRVVLAHEASHLEHRHPWWLLAAELAAALHPPLGPTARAVGEAVERWADEDAARSVADRRLAARTLAKTALLVHRGPSVARSGGLDVSTTHLPGRVEALLAPSPRRRPGATAVLIGLVVASVAAAVVVQQSGERLFEQAFTAPPASSCAPGTPPPAGCGPAVSP